MNETTNEQRIERIKTVLAWGVAVLAAAVLVLVTRPRRINAPPPPPPALQITTNQDGTTELGISGPEEAVQTNNVNALGTNLTVELVLRTKETNVPGVICQVRTELVTNQSTLTGLPATPAGTNGAKVARVDWFSVHEATTVTLPNGLVLSWTNPVMHRAWMIGYRERTVQEPYRTNYWRSNQFNRSISLPML